jgi:hypothetical protein
MPNLNVNILGRDGNTRAKVTGQEELLVSVNSVSSSSGLATEVTLKSVETLSSLILAAIQAGTEYEEALVLDDADVTWLEVRIYNQSTGSFDTPSYYLAGSNTPGTPTFPITYINPNSYLAQIVSNTADISTIATNTAPANRTPGILSSTGAGATPSPVYSLSIANVGGADGVVNGVTIPAGVTISFDGGGLNNTLDPMSYNASGTTFIITYIS